jgi:CRISPR type IV-associated protein Csf3
MEALKVTAFLANGFASKFEWAPSIDGIIAWAYQREKLGVEEFTLTQHRLDLQAPVTGLPIGIEYFQGDWWYQCSIPIFDIKATATSNIHRRFNVREAEAYCHDKKTKIETTKGPYKNARLLLRQFITPKVEYHVIGDMDEIQRLLKTITHIGTKLGSGFGRVQEWVVEKNGDENKARFLRPLPKPFAELHNVSGMVLEWGVRPPSRLAENLRTCVIPNARQ